MTSTAGKPPIAAEDLVVGLQGQGIKWLPGVVLGASMGATQPVSFLVTQLTAAGTTIDVNFETEFSTSFSDVNYGVVATSDEATGPIGWTAKTATSIQLTGTAADEVVTLILVGKTRTQP